MTDPLVVLALTLAAVALAGLIRLCDAVRG
jgi:hypothetical protein